MAKASLSAMSSDDPARPETVRFALDGCKYEIDLPASEAQEFRRALQPFVAAARRISKKLRSVMVASWTSGQEGHIGYAVPEFSDGITALEWRYEDTPPDQVLVHEPQSGGLESTRSVADAVGWRVACLCGGLGKPLAEDWVGPLVCRTSVPGEATSRVHFASSQRVLQPPAEVVAALRDEWWRRHGRVASLVEDWQYVQAELRQDQRRVDELLVELQAAGVELTTMPTLEGYDWSSDLEACPHADGTYLAPRPTEIEGPALSR